MKIKVCDDCLEELTQKKYGEGDYLDYCENCRTTEGTFHYIEED